MAERFSTTETVFFLLIFLLLIGVPFVFGFMIGRDSGKAQEKTRMRTEAINLGIGEYLIVDPENGKIEFRWKECECK